MPPLVETDAEDRLVLSAQMLGDAKPHSKFAVEENGSSPGIHPEFAALADSSAGKG